jgi:hypothetical protein
MACYGMTFTFTLRYIFFYNLVDDHRLASLSNTASFSTTAVRYELPANLWTVHLERRSSRLLTKGEFGRFNWRLSFSNKQHEEGDYLFFVYVITLYMSYLFMYVFILSYFLFYILFIYIFILYISYLFYHLCIYEFIYVYHIYLLMHVFIFYMSSLFIYLFICIFIFIYRTYLFTYLCIM